MTVPTHLRNIGDEVIVMDARGDYFARGAVVGVHRIDPPVYDVQQRGDLALSRRLCGIPESRLRSVSPRYMAYERGTLVKPRHFDEQI